MRTTSRRYCLNDQLYVAVVTELAKGKGQGVYVLGLARPKYVAFESSVLLPYWLLLSKKYDLICGPFLNTSEDLKRRVLELTNEF